MGKPAIKCVSLGKQYTSRGQAIQAVSGINMHVDHNELVLIKGRSGAGKSTLLFLMSGLIKPSQGRVMIGDTCISEMHNPELSHMLLHKIGIIFQNFNLLPTYTVYENIEIALTPVNLGKEAIKKMVMPLLGKFHLEDKKDSLPSELSIGQQQKVAIIRTLVKEPSIIYADEPTGSVDEETAGEIFQHLLFLKQVKKATLVVTSHGGFPETLADRVLMMENGKLAGRDQDL